MKKDVGIILILCLGMFAMGCSQTIQPCDVDEDCDISLSGTIGEFVTMVCNLEVSAYDRCLELQPDFDLPFSLPWLDLNCEQYLDIPEVGVCELEATSTDSAPGPERLAASDQLGREIEQALGGLSVQDRMVLLLREVQRRPYSEIAELLELPMGTLKARLHRAREQLRKKLIRAGVTP